MPFDFQNSPEKKAQPSGQVAKQKKSQSKGAYLQDNRSGQGVFQKMPVVANKPSADKILQKKQKQNGLPDQLKSGVEQLSGYSMDDVKVHYNSDKPAQMQAHAFAQGNEIHIASGQEKHLAHEAWHVVQQKQGRVRPTMQLKDATSINDDPQLEKEADIMGAKSLQRSSSSKNNELLPIPVLPRIVQKFADQENDIRRSRASQDSGEDMQLDHAISQNAIKEFYKVFEKILSLPNAIKPPEFVRFRELCRQKFGEQGISLEGVNAFLNLRNNLSPGFKNTTGNPGNSFDPQIEVKGDEVQETDQSEQLEIMDLNMRYITRRVKIIEQMHTLDRGDEDDDDNPFIAYQTELNNEFKALCDAFEVLGSRPENYPAYDPAHWYDFGELKVKKVPAKYLQGDNQLLDRLGTKKMIPYPLSIKKTLYVNNHEIGDDRRRKILTSVKIPINVVITVPSATWRHIYSRHTIECFSWDIQAINTFWKTDPRQIFRLYEDEIAGALLLIIDRQIDIEAEIFNVKNSDPGEAYIYGQINEAGGGFFFQGSYEFEEANHDGESESESDTASAAKIDCLSIDLKSFAPQNPDMAYAILPSILEARKPPGFGGAASSSSSSAPAKSKGGSKAGDGAAAQ
jgi:hypothetical protein